MLASIPSQSPLIWESPFDSASLHPALMVTPAAKRKAVARLKESFGMRNGGHVKPSAVAA